MAGMTTGMANYRYEYRYRRWYCILNHLLYRYLPDVGTDMHACTDSQKLR